MFKYTTPKILILGNQMIIAADVSLQFTKMGYNVIGIINQFKGVLKLIEENRPDIVLMNIENNGKANSLNVARYISKKIHIPIVFLSANSSEDHFKEVLEIQPYAHINIPFKIKDLKRGIETALSRMGA
ncbi:MAG: AmiR/NasT family two-component response regulator [Saprospiraceae bacterium]|jgi:AmiR/NasT family two-component response regulator